jgi:hypothetical protein
MSEQTTMRWVMTSLKKNYGVWPVIAFAFGFGPAFVVYATYHQLTGPDARLGRDFEPWQRFANKKFKLLSSEDYENYVHPRPKF